ncbi:amino acid ABC transporter ATP-binding protein [Peptacetobacter hominis]|uniref:Amino acid ABC transporter ATP-binding protein n=1 Tax=Peptacetobacter hominis TaxID=2743610 RepID=A0A544QWX3_9FIRM|nr:amino acid ABC transporter ATP-binding protein [Peptacetobacter hominis]TQQ85206.1 amino acid ABC transporter ATP-binding protein [Peptacetobacter hominis]
MLEVKGIKKSFKNNEVLKGISFSVESGETAVLLGKSGAGKTTIMRCINGLETFDEGELIIDGQEIKTPSDMKKIRGKIGMVFQNFNLFPHMTVMENIIESPVNVFKRDREESIGKARELLKMVDLEDKEDFYPFQLSGGQQQRVAIARSCALMPRVLCFDEPTSALDPETVNKVVDIINKLKKSGMAILIVTHDVMFAEKVADKKITVKDGYIDSIEEK